MALFKEATTSFKKIIVTTIMILVILTLSVSLFIDSAILIEPLSSTNYYTLETGWRVEKEGVLVEDEIMLPFRITGDIKDKTITVTRRLPNTFSHNHICFSTYTSMTSLEIIVDGKSIYNYHGNNTLWKNPVLGGHTAHFVYLPDNSHGKEIRLVYNFTANNRIAGLIEVPRIGTKTDLIAQQLNDWPSIVFGFIFLTLGGIVFLISFLYSHKNERDSLRYYGLLELTLGMWVFTQTISKLIIIRNPIAPLNFSVLALFLLPYALIQYVKSNYDVLEKKTNPFYVASLIFLCMFVVGGVSQYFGFFQYTDMLMLSGLFLVIFIISLTIVLAIDFYKGNRGLRSFLAAIIVLFITVAAEEVLLILDICLQNALILHIGMGISGTILLIRTAHVIASERATSAKERMLLDLVFIDSLTGVRNRRSYDEFINMVTHGEYDGDILGLLVCDINGLKKINDELGHPSGDALLKDFTYNLSSLLPEASTVYRIGGDEFVATIPDITSAQLELLCKEIFNIPTQSKIGNYSVAIGARLYSASHTLSIVHLIKEADKAMYECKARMKNGNNEFICKELG